MLRLLRLPSLLSFKTLACLLLFALLATGVLHPAGQAAAAEDVPYGQGLLWRIQKDGGPANHLLGTMHSTDPRLRRLPQEIDGALEQSQVVAFEIVTGQEGDADMSQALRLPPERSLEDILGPELFARAAEAVADFGVAPGALQRFKPWALSFFLARPRIETIRQSQGEAAFDFWLQGEARRRGKSLHGLESYAEQIEVFDGLSEAEQVAMVSDLLNDYAGIEAQFNKMFRAYLKGDIGTLMTIANDHSGVSDTAAAERLTARLIDDRNRTMVQRMLQPHHGPAHAAAAGGRAGLHRRRRPPPARGGRYSQPAGAAGLPDLQGLLGPSAGPDAGQKNPFS
jgi:uncharacterized protein YbaP (TraB family)